ncbi:magnesium transporter CorA family protein [Enterococcus sp. DIV0660C]|uniref:magnesium transporter CorA family protein n=1 Tax=Enterococcus sp. DIV0660C TaxID=2230880 RepID=UPI001A901CBD|nr:magnesium transporter CorA family protein [Enterococcus sp. DIV0660C]MBO0432086.1 magnesium transporter CorA family protein [Enterococcus sp. DIV0660C]
MELLTTSTPTTWIDLNDINHLQLKTLTEQYDIPNDFLSYALDKDESARIEKDYASGTLLIIYDLPYKDESDIADYSSGPMTFIINKRVIITNFSNKKMREELTPLLASNTLNPKYKTAFVLHWMLQISKRFLDYLRVLNRQRTSIEQALGSTPKNKELLLLMKIERSLIYFIMSLKSNFMVINKIRSGKYLKLYDEDHDLLDDLIIELEQGMDMAEISNRIINEMTDSYYSLISNDTNSIMKILTIVSVILTIPTIVFSFYGMNVPLPFTQNRSFAWETITAIALILSVISSIILIRRDYFSK